MIIIIVTDACSYSDVVLPVTCDVHEGRSLEYYCETDQVTVCSECAVLGDHQGHQIVGCEEKVGRIFHHTSLCCFQGWVFAMPKSISAVAKVFLPGQSKRW